jgi:hypothetical protein
MRTASARGERREALAGRVADAPEPHEALFAPLPEYLTTRQLAEYLGYAGKRRKGAAQKFIDRKGLRRYWRSARVSMVRRADVDAVLAGRVQWGQSR